MCRLLGADVIEFFFTPRGSIVKFECEYEREKRGDWSRIARGKNECSKFCGWKPLWTGKALLREGEFSKWWRRDWKRRDWSVIPIFILLGASRARGAIWESMNISYSLDSVYIWMQVDTAALLVPGSRRTGSSRTLCKGRRNVSQTCYASLWILFSETRKFHRGQASMEIYPSKIIRKKNLRKNPVQKTALEISLLRCYCLFFLQERDTEYRGRSLISEKFKTFLSTVPRKLELLAANGCGLVERWSRQVGRF